jgi:signal transduction histidine kinase
MTSILVLKNEINDIFLEHYSGFWAKETEMNGHGIGMFYAKRLIEMNKGRIEFVPGEELYRLNGIPYAHNTIIIELKRV